MARYTMDEVRIEGAYTVEKLQELAMDVGVNRHGSLTYGGLAPEEDALRFVNQAAEGQTVKVFLRDELEFCGCPQAVTVDNRNGHCYMRVTLATTSQLMDVFPRNRFFQDTGKSFADIITEALEDSGTGSLVAVRGKEKIRRPILQYLETDWRFIMRMAGRLCTVVIPNVTSTESQASLGIPKRGAITENNDVVYSVSRDAAEFRRKFAVDDDTGYHDFLCYKMKSENRYKLGDSVTVDGDKLVIMQKTFEYERGEIQEFYVMGHERDFAVPLHHNKRIAGLELEGKVLERSGQEIKALLDIDAARKDCAKTWFYYAPVTNNGMYSIPLEGEKVMLGWQSELDHDILILRPSRKNSQDMQNPGQRHFLTDHDNHLMMVPGKVEYTNPAGSMQWLKSQGFNLNTGFNVDIYAQEDVIIKSMAQVRVYSPERITMIKTLNVKIDEETTILKPISSIDMLSNYIHIKADTNVVTTSKANNFKKSVLPERTPNIVPDKSKASKVTGAIPIVSDPKNLSKEAQTAIKANASKVLF